MITNCDGAVSIVWPNGGVKEKVDVRHHLLWVFEIRMVGVYCMKYTTTLATCNGASVKQKKR